MSHDAFANQFVPLFLKKRIMFKEATVADATSFSAYKNHKKQKGVNGSVSVATTTPTIPSVDNSWEQVWSVGPGLANLGNTCFLNSVLQCITYTPALVRFFKSGQHRCLNSDSFCVVCSMSRHTAECFPKQTSVLRPITFVSSLRLIAKHMRPGRQEDAHEFLRYLLDAMHTKLTTNIAKSTPITHIFGGRLLSTITCLSCGHISECIDAFMDLSLDIHQVDSLERALHKFTTPELLQKGNRYKCSGCNAMVDARKTMSIHTLPATLTIHLKRFNHDGSKITKHIAYKDSLDLSTHCKASNGESMDVDTKNNSFYQLYAVLVHEGFSCNSGHYHCFVKAPNDIWYSMNDSSVHSVGLSTVLQQRAYILFYRKCVNKNESPVTPPNSRPGTPREEERRVEPVTPEVEKENGDTEAKKKKKKYTLSLPQATSMWHVGLHRSDQRIAKKHKRDTDWIIKKSAK